jgi:AcrR family transcriptional regulator
MRERVRDRERGAFEARERFELFGRRAHVRVIAHARARRARDGAPRSRGTISPWGRVHVGRWASAPASIDAVPRVPSAPRARSQGGRRAKASGRKEPRRAPKQERSEDTIRALLTATTLVAQDVGVRHATVAAIAARAGVGVGTVFHYFPTKVALLAAWEEDALGRIREILMSEISRLLETTPPLDYCIRRIVHVGCALYIEHTHVRRGARGGPPLLKPLARLGVRMDITTKLAEIGADALRRVPDAHLLRPKNLVLTMQLSIETVFAMMDFASAVHPTRIASGELQEEIASMICRYFIGDAADATPRSNLDAAANIPSLWAREKSGA